MQDSQPMIQTHYWSHNVTFSEKAFKIVYHRSIMDFIEFDDGDDDDLWSLLAEKALKLIKILRSEKSSKVRKLAIWAKVLL